MKSRILGINGWFSTNILGNRDGEVLEDPGSFKTKEETKLSVLDTILQPELYPQLYKDLYHSVKINYYPPRGDSKEGWDNIDIFGWLGYPMQIKIDFLCRDSIGAPVLTLAVYGSGAAGCAAFRMAVVLLQRTMTPGLYPRRHLYSDEAEEPAAAPDGRGTHHAPGSGILRLGFMRILVISGTLFIGRALVKELVKAGHQVSVLHRKPEHDMGKQVGNLMADHVARRPCAAQPPSL